MKALYVSPNGYLGGAEEFLLDLCRAHLHSGFVEPTILFLNGGEAETEARRLGIQTLQLPFSVKLSNPFSLLRTSFWIRSYLKEHQIEILHLTMPYAQIVSTFSSLFLNVKRIWFQHGPIGGWLDRVASLIPSDAILFNSKYLMQVHQKHCFGLQKRKYQKIHGLIPVPQNPVSVSLRNSPSSSPIQVACVGRITEWKGQDLFIRSLKQVFQNEKDVPSFQAWIIGSAKRESDREYETSLKELVKKLDISEVVKFLGHLDL